MVKPKKAKWYQVALFEGARYLGIASLISAPYVLNGCIPTSTNPINTGGTNATLVSNPPNDNKPPKNKEKPEMQDYLNYGFFDYPEEIGKNEVDKYWKEGMPLEYAGALVKQVFAGANDIFEWPFEAAGWLLDDVGYSHFGGKARGEKNKHYVRNAVKFSFNRVWGGKGNDKFNEGVLRFNPKMALDGSYGIEDTPIGGHIGTAATIASGGLAVDAIIKGFGGKPWIDSLFGTDIFGRGGDGVVGGRPIKPAPPIPKPP